jgi:hypothetical protein
VLLPSDLEVTSPEAKHSGARHLERHSEGGLRRRLAFKTYFRSAALISCRFENTFRPEARAVDAADPLHYDAPNPWHPSPAEGGKIIAGGTFREPRSGSAGRSQWLVPQPNCSNRHMKKGVAVEAQPPSDVSPGTLISVISPNFNVIRELFY